MKKIITLILIMCTGILCFSLRVKAAYNYDPFGDVVASAEGFIFDRVVDSSNLIDIDGNKSNYKFGDLHDIFAYGDKIYVVDGGNGRVVVLNEEFRYVTDFGGEQGLSKPRGIYVTEHYIYIADTDNRRIAVFNHDYELIREITAPDDPSFQQSGLSESGYDFKPLKLAVSAAGRMYVVADQIFEGIIDFNPDGTFSRYIGASTITLSVWDAFWLFFTTETQRKAQGFRLATSFVNINIDEKGHLYTLSALSEGDKVIKKLNNKGHDILWRNGYVPLTGDIARIYGNVSVPTGASEFVDIDLNNYGGFAVLDKTRGRIFVYDFEGYILYIGGSIGNIGGAVNNQSHLFISPEALCYYRDGLLVADSVNKNLVVFGYSEFARSVNKATEQYYYGNYEEARLYWEEALLYNSNYYLAYAGIGKAELRAGNYKKAMVNLKLGYDDYNYSRAYRQYRYEITNVIFPYIAAAALAAAAYLFVRSITSAVRRESEEEKDE